MPEALIALVTLTAMEVVLGIDNIVFIAILCGRLPEHQREKGRKIGLGVALLARLALLSVISVILGWTEAEFTWTQVGLDHIVPATVFADTAINEVSIRDMILFFGGLFLLAKSVHEIHSKIEGHSEHHEAPKHPSFGYVMFQIALIDVVFSLDSVITAVAMAQDVWVMYVAVVLAIGIMLAFSGKINEFIERHPTLKILALSFLILIGVVLVADGLGTHINKGYIYFAMAFAIVVEMVNLKVRGSAVAAKKTAVAEAE